MISIKVPWGTSKEASLVYFPRKITKKDYQESLPRGMLVCLISLQAELGAGDEFRKNNLEEFSYGVKLKGEDQIVEQV